MAITILIVRTLSHFRPNEAYKLPNSSDMLTYADLEWIESTTKPTETELENDELATVRDERKALVKTEAMERISALWNNWEQNNAALGLYDSDYTTTKSVVDATNASPIVVTITGHNYHTGDKVTTASIGGNNAANVSDNAITVLTVDTFELDSTTGDGSYTSGGTSKRQKLLAIKNDISTIRFDSDQAEIDIDAESVISNVDSFTW